MKNKLTFSQAVLLCFLAVSLLILCQAFALEHFIFTRTFSNYLEDQNIAEDLEWVAFIDSSFQEGRDPSFDLHRSAMMDGLQFTFLDKDQNVAAIIDADTMGMGHMTRIDTKLVTRVYPLEHAPFASVVIGRPKSTLLALPEQTFRSNINRGFLLIGAFSLLLASAVAFWLSRQVSKPIKKLQTYAESLTKAQWDQPLLPGSSMREIESLQTSLLHLSQQLQAQDQLRRRLTANISHELRTPLNILLNQLEAIHDGVLPLNPKRSATLIQEIHRLSRLVAQIEGLNDLSQQTQMEWKQVNLSKLLQDLSTIYRPLFAAKKLSFLSDFPESLALSSQEDALRQILVNLLENALRYTPEGGTVQFSAQADGQTITIAVEDDGIGIPEQDLPHIFDRFYRVDPARGKETGGSGLGLSLVKELLETLHGSIACESQLGQGTIFTIRFPLH